MTQGLEDGEKVVFVCLFYNGNVHLIFQTFILHENKWICGSFTLTRATYMNPRKELVGMRSIEMGEK